MVLMKLMLQSDAHIVVSNSGVVNCPAELGAHPESFSNTGMHTIESSPNQN